MLSGTRMKIKGTVVLTKRNLLDFNDLGASLLDGVHELLGKKVTLQLISSSHVANPGNSLEGKPAHLEQWLTTFTPLAASDSAFNVTFDWDKDNGVPGAFLVRNEHHSEFYLKTLTLEDVPGGGGQGRVHFVCNSWVYPTKYYKRDRVFFANKTYLPDETPLHLRSYRKQELVDLRGDGEAELQQWDRVYDYAPYNDLGDPHKGQKYVRPVLGGSSGYPYPRRGRTGRPPSESDPHKGQKYVRPVLGGSSGYPYPRRGRTGRPPSESDPNTESRVPLLSSLNIYVPADERLNHVKMSDFIAYSVRTLGHFIKPEVEALFDSTPKEFDSFDDIMELYRGGVKLPEGSILDHIKNVIPFEMIKDAFQPDGAGHLSYPLPKIVKEDKSAWRTDEEFAREMLAGLHPVLIRRLEEFPPKSKMDYEIYGDQNSSITEDHMQHNLDGMSVHEAIEHNRLFILDHHDLMMPYMRRINATSAKAYAARTLLFLREDSTLKPVAIELSLPHPDGDQCGAISKVYTPADDGVEGSIWQLAKAYAGVNDNYYHQLISHWLETHVVVEPFIIATNRQLSVLHPINKLLHPHFRDTMNINALARQSLVNAGGFLELAVLPSQYSMEMSSKAYKNWVFPEQALPEDLKKRGMAVEDPESRHGLRLLIEDYPYAVDGLEIWSAIKEWVKDYCSMYYKTDEMVQGDQELQSWWKELREQGHHDKKDEHWWPKMQTREELIESCTIIIWLASAFHAAVNFGMYAYAGYLPNRPTVSRRFMPEKGSPEYEELKSNPERVFLQTITAQLQTLLGMSLVELFSIHSADEVYLGQRDTPEWTSDSEALQAFNKFGKRLAEIEERMIEMNKDTKLKNRVGPVQLPYTSLVPNSESGLTGRGIPNSITI